MKYLFAFFLAICITLTSIAPTNMGFTQDKEPKVVKMEDVKQTLLGLDKEYEQGKLVKIKVSPLPKSSNIVTAIYKFTLLENGKVSQNLETLNKNEKNTDPPKTTADLIFAIESINRKYQILFAPTYIETKPGTAEIVSVQNPEIQLYDVKVSGSAPVDPVNPDVPVGNYGMIRTVYLECQKIQLDKDKKVKLFTNLANAFSGMSSKIAAGVYKDATDEAEQADNINKFLKEAKELNNKAMEDSGVDKTKFDGTFDVAVKTKLEELFNQGKARKFGEYQAIWAEIAEGFRLAAK